MEEREGGQAFSTSASFVTRNGDFRHFLFNEILPDSIRLQGFGHTNGTLMMNSGTKGTWDLVFKICCRPVFPQGKLCFSSSSSNAVTMK